MPRQKTYRSALFCLLLPALAGCHPTRGTASPDDYFPLIQLAIQGAETGAMIGRNQAIQDKNFAGCVAAETSISALGAASQVLAGRLAGTVIIPGVEVDVSDCLPLRKEATSSDAEMTEATKAQTLELVTMLTGATTSLVTHYALELQKSKCKEGTVALAVVNYLNGLAIPIAEEVLDSDGKLETASVVVDLSTCDES